jgi:hypothetical protein
MRLWITYWLLLVAILAVPVQAQVLNLEQLMEESGATLQVSEAMVEVPVQANEIFSYQRGYRSDDKLLELRVALRPLQRLQIEYQDPHNAAPEANHIFPLIFDSLVGQLARSGRMPSREYSTEEAKQKFNADWAAAAVFDIEPEFSSDYQQALLLALHRNNRADAYLVFLFDDYDQVKQTLRQNLAALRFSEGF